MVELSGLSVKELERKNRYETLLNKFDSILIEYVLIDSYNKFKENKKNYPFLDLEGLKPGSIGYGVLEETSLWHNDALVFFTEDRVKDELKEFIKIKDKYKIIKKRLVGQKGVDKDFASKFDVYTTFIENKGFENTLKGLLKSDRGLLIQPKDEKYALTHYRVEVSQGTDPVVESLAKKLGYIDIEKNLDEYDEAYKEKLEEKFFAYYGFHYTAGGRRKAGIIASQMFGDMGMSFATYIASKEARTLTKITENDKKVRYALVNLSNEKIRELEKLGQGFREQFVYDKNICVLQVTYDTTKYSRPIKSGIIRELDQKRKWLEIIKEMIIPKRKFVDTRPIPYNIVYPHKDYSAKLIR